MIALRRSGEEQRGTDGEPRAEAGAIRRCCRFKRRWGHRTTPESCGPGNGEELKGAPGQPKSLGTDAFTASILRGSHWRLILRGIERLLEPVGLAAKSSEGVRSRQKKKKQGTNFGVRRNPSHEESEAGVPRLGNCDRI